MTPELILDHFVGRHEELAALRECFERAASGRPTLVAVSGEAGIGKSRIVRELLSSVETNAGATGVGHCLEHLKMPFLPFGEIVSGLGLNLGFDLQQDDPPVMRGRAQTERHVRRMQTVAHALLNASSKPYVVVIEDVHWADAGTLGLLEHLAMSSTRGRLLVIITVRSEAVERGGAFARVLSKLRGAGLVSLRLSPLSAPDMTALLRTASPTELSRATAERIKRMAEGNPLFAEELLRAALDQTTIHPAYASIRATVVDRLYRLSEADQRVLTCASVVGRFFDPNLVATLAERPFDETIAALRRARNQQLVREVPGEASRLAFRHTVFTEVVYGELLDLEARNLHSRVAKYLEKNRGTQRHTAEIAYHYGAAGEKKKALEYNAQAGDEAMQLAAFEDAAGFYGQALGYVAAGSVRYAELCEKRAYAWYAAGVAENTAVLFSDALTAYEALGDNLKVVEMLLFLSRQAWNDAETPDGYSHAIRATDLIGNGDPAMRDYALTMAASYAVHMGRVDEAGRIAQSLTVTNPDISARIIDTRAFIHARRGEVDEALQLCAEAQLIAQQSGDPDVLVRVYSNSADISAISEPRKTSAALWREAYLAAQAGGYIGRMAYAALGYAAALIDCGDLTHALELYNIAIETGVRNASVLIQAAGVGAVLGALLGHVPPLFIDQDAALQLALRSKESLRISQLSSCLAFAHICADRRTDAEGILERAIGSIDSAAFAESLLLLGVAYGNLSTKVRANALLQSKDVNVADRSVLNLCRRAADAARAGGSTQTARLQSIGETWEKQNCRILQIVTLQMAKDHATLRKVLRAIGAAEYLRRLEAPPSKPAPGGITKLTRRELDVARLLAEAESNRGIAERLHISERTVEHHVSTILSRLGVRSRWLVTMDLMAKSD